MIVEMRGIHKSFGSNEVLQDVNFSLKGGEICALLGENGAGKSTLMNILGGVLPADQGEIFLDGEAVVFETPAESLGSGIAFIHQELNLINDLAVYENMFIGREVKKKNGLLDAEVMIRETQAVFERMGIDMNPKTMVRDLDSSYKQIVEISRALMMNASIIIMDEPTSSLVGPEIERVFEMMRNLKNQGVGLVFISHKLQEVMQICDRYTILRDGKMVAEGEISGEVTTDDLARYMVGHKVRTTSLQRPHKTAHEILRVDNLNDGKNFRDISLSVRAGEILGITGLLGDGRSELFLSIFGAGQDYTGQVYIEERPIKLQSPTHALDYGIGYLPRNRKENGIIKDMNILENGTIVTWPLFTKFGFINFPYQNKQFDTQVDRLRIKMSKKNDRITSLSGGNQQKVILAKWLSTQPKLLILDNPTQGVDVGAKEEIYDIILNLADEGVAVVVLFSEAQEIIRICDRALVMYHGTIQGELAGSEMNEHEIMRLATGAFVK
ncbi:MAG: ribose transport system ATP-binding protein [Chloroflexota bacterium]|nr:ribose transport system ATP-binding protein [Chloroflexota bacterium]